MPLRGRVIFCRLHEVLQLFPISKKELLVRLVVGLNLRQMHADDVVGTETVLGPMTSSRKIWPRREVSTKCFDKYLPYHMEAKILVEQTLNS